MKYILASSSPRRKELMQKISAEFLIDVSDADETVSKDLSPIEAVKIIAFRKGEVVRHRHPNDIVISADTIVVIDNEIIGKPIDENDAVRILKKLNNRTHIVYTAYCIFYKNQVFEDAVASEVLFNNLSDELINDYVKANLL